MLKAFLHNELLLEKHLQWFEFSNCHQVNLATTTSTLNFDTAQTSHYIFFWKIKIKVFLKNKNWLPSSIDVNQRSNYASKRSKRFVDCTTLFKSCTTRFGTLLTLTASQINQMLCKIQIDKKSEIEQIEKVEREKKEKEKIYQTSWTNLHMTSFGVFLLRTNVDSEHSVWSK